MDHLGLVAFSRVVEEGLTTSHSVGRDIDWPVEGLQVRYSEEDSLWVDQPQRWARNHENSPVAYCWWLLVGSAILEDSSNFYLCCA